MARGAAAWGCLVVLFAAFSAEAQTKDLRKRWLTVQSEHFEVNYPEPLALIARRVLWVAERAHEKLRPLLGHQPRRRVRIVLNDDVDTANGNAYFAPLDLSDFRQGTGAELHLDFTLGYTQPMSLRVGFAYGFDEGGGAQFYVGFGRPF